MITKIKSTKNYPLQNKEKKTLDYKFIGRKEQRTIQDSSDKTETETPKNKQINNN